ncbi:MAG: 3'-5' exonuclease, partial [Dehalococcoidia bacterium]|nr:3'-5' exonuclease [Dehalococcoidia bacterium]
RFYERREVKDVIAYLRLVHNPYDRISFERVVNVPPRGIGAKTLDELSRWAESLGLPPYSALQLLAEDREPRPHRLASRSVTALLGFLALMNELIDEAKTRPVADLMAAVLQRTGYRQYLFEEFVSEMEQGLPGGEARWANVEQLLTLARQYDALDPESALPQLLEDIALVSDQDEYDQRSDAVTLITLHAAKGLEFPVVFIVGMEEGVLPHMRSFDAPAQLEEERRLCYVGITRAKERLYLVRAFRRYLMGSSLHNPPSRFLKDLPKDLIAGRKTVEDEAAERRYRGPALARLRRGDGGDDGRAAVPAEAVYSAGDRVRHDRFGEGVVVNCVLTPTDQEVTVAFKGGAGVKKLLLSYAPLEKV